MQSSLNESKWRDSPTKMEQKDKDMGCAQEWV